MKKNSNFLLTSLRVGMPVLAVFCSVTAGAVTAADKPVAEKAAAIQKEVKKHSDENIDISKKISEAETLASKEGKYDEAFKALDEASKLLDAKKVIYKSEKLWPAYLQELVIRFESSRKAIGVLAGEAKFQDAKNLYQEAAKAGVSAAAAEKATNAKSIAEDARYIFYMAPIGKSARDLDALDQKITPRNQDFSVRVSQLIAACDKIVKAFEVRSQTDTAAVDPDYANRQERINKLYAQAGNLYRNSQYTKARDLCEQIFIEDPYNAKAIALLDKIYKKLYFYSELRAYNEILRSDAETIWLWNNALPERGKTEKVTTARVAEDPLLDKLNSWKISVQFNQTSIKDAISRIRELSQEIDPRHVGINFLERGITGTPQESMLVTLELDNAPIAVILSYLCKQAGISWKTNEAFVLYGHGISDYESTEIPMRNSVYHQITTEEGEEEEGGESTDDTGWGTKGLDSIKTTISESSKKKMVVSDKKLRAFFVDRGIPFDEHSSVIYNSKTHKLAVTNTRENLAKLERLVREIDIATPLVLIESKILEITVNDEEELGFDWSATYTNDKNSDYNFAFNSPLRQVAPSAVNAIYGIVNDKLINNLNIIPNMNLDGGHQLNFYLTVSAVDRTDRMEQLATPKVVVKNGETAVIKMVQSMYFPDSWESPDTEIDDGDVAMETAYPEFGEPQEVGIQFTVTPTVSSDNYTV
ncbi:MAG: hypothetical protein J6Q65_06980, partial [Lentisphaeria bacterium]|nr:hypothetical protein [Lentisphaeria bacterium]